MSPPRIDTLASSAAIAPHGARRTSDSDGHDIKIESAHSSGIFGAAHDDPGDESHRVVREQHDDFIARKREL
jgi:hypothetical protein